MRERLLSLLSDGVFVSGEMLAEYLGVSRTAVWRQINSLRGLGYGIDSVKNKGYRLVSRPDIPFPEEILSGLDTGVIGRRLYYFKTLSSTNLFARKLVDNGVEEGAVVVADVQTHGRGRLGRQWFSPDGGLWFSIILYLNIPPHKSMMLTMAASVSVVQGIKKVSGLDSRIKWPNDVLIRGRKICGILTEINAEVDRLNFAIVGIGLNVNNRVGEDLCGKATTLRRECGMKVSRVKILKSILECFDENYGKLVEGDYDFIRKNWMFFSDVINKKVRVMDENTSKRGVVRGIDDDGCLVLETDDGVFRIVSGDMEYL
ncbi:birA, biotin-(acetyl-CoA-carboxylase) ligase [Thermoplasmatales archaeon SCGC AB-539-N05]|nr:birA, biotin-(acetyl-CoA-carboxylase) ligase [Thermoplasmatales archaeon SCGC AB-539-N05]